MEEIEFLNFQDDARTERRKSIKFPDQGKPLKAAVEEIVSYYEKLLIEKALLKNQQNRTRTARSLEITRKTLARKIEKYNL